MYMQVSHVECLRDMTSITLPCNCIFLLFQLLYKSGIKEEIQDCIVHCDNFCVKVHTEIPYFLFSSRSLSISFFEQASML